MGFRTRGIKFAGNHLVASLLSRRFSASFYLWNTSKKFERRVILSFVLPRSVEPRRQWFWRLVKANDRIAVEYELRVLGIGFGYRWQTVRPDVLNNLLENDRKVHPLPVIKLPQSQSTFILKGHEVVHETDRYRWEDWMTANRLPGRGGPVTRDETLVATTELSGMFVCTVFTGYSSLDPPLVFETRVFGKPLDGEVRCYSTWEQAEQGHREMIESIKTWLEKFPKPTSKDTGD